MHRRDGDHGLVRRGALVRQGVGHQIEAAASLHRRHADTPGQGLHHGLVAGEHAHIADGAPGDSQGRKPLAAALAGKTFHEAVRGDVGALARIADEGRGRREQDEVVERPVAGRRIEVLRADDLRTDHRVERRDVQVGDEPVLKDSRRVDHASQLSSATLDLRKHPVHGRTAGDVHRLGLDLHPALGQFGQKCLRLIGRRALAAGQDDVLRAAIREPARRLQAEAAEATGDEVDAIGRHREGLGDVLEHRARLGRADHDLTDVTGLLHQPERVRGLGRREGLVGQWLQAAVVEQRHHFAEHPRAIVALVLDHLIEIDAEVAEVPPERPQADMGVGDVIALAQFDESPERTKRVEGALHCLAEQAVQHDIDAIAGDRADIVHEGERAGIEHMFGAEGLYQGPLLARARRRDDASALELGDLQRGEADTTRAAMDQHPLAAPHPGTGDESVIGGEERHGHRRRRHRIDTLRHRRDDEVGDHDMRGEAGLGEGDDGIADLETLHARTHRRDAARTFETQAGTGEAVLQNLLRQHRERPENVAEVKAGGLHGDFQFALARRDPLGGPPDHLVQAAGVAALQTRRLGRYAIRRIAVARPAGMEAHDLCALVIEHDLGFRRAGKDEVAQALGGALRRHLGREVDAADIEVRHLVGQGAGEGPHARLDIGHLAAAVTGGARRHDPETRLAGTEMLDTPLQAHAAVAQPLGRFATAGEGTGEEDHRIRCLLLQLHQRRLGIEDDRDVDAARDQQGRQRRGGLGGEIVVGPDDEGEALCRSRGRPDGRFRHEEKVVAVAGNGAIDGDRNEARRAERTLPAADIVEPPDGQAAHPLLEPIRRQAEDEIAEQRDAGLYGDHQAARRQSGGKIPDEAALATMQAARADDEIETTRRELTRRFHEGRGEAEGQTSPLGQAPVSLEDGEACVRLARERRDLRRERAVAHLKHAQSTLLRQLGQGAVEQAREGRRRMARRGRAHDERIDGALRQVRNVGDVARQDAVDGGSDIRDQNQLRRKIRVVRRDPAHDLVGRGKGRAITQTPRVVLVLGETAALQRVERIDEPRAERGRQARVGEGDDAGVPRQTVRETEGERGRPAFEQKMPRRERGIGWTLHLLRQRPQARRHARAPLHRDRRRLGREFGDLADRVGCEFVAALATQRLNRPSRIVAITSPTASSKVKSARMERSLQRRVRITERAMEAPGFTRRISPKRTGI